MIPVVIVLAVILALCAWIYGWGGGPIMEVSYWHYQPDHTSWFANTCRGSMETFYTLYEKYNPTA